MKFKMGSSSKSKSSGGCAGIIIGTIFTVLGGGISFFLGFGSMQTEQYLRSLPVVNAAQFGDTAVGSEVIVSGVLQGNQERDGGLVYYVEQEWDVEYDSDNGYEGDWVTRRQVFPTLTLLVGGTPVTVNGVDSLRRYGNFTTSVILVEGTGRRADGYAEGTIRVWGLVNGDMATFVGTRAENGGLIPTRVNGGEVNALYESQQWETWFGFGFGGLFACIGVVVLVVSLFGALRWVVGLGRGRLA